MVIGKCPQIDEEAQANAWFYLKLLHEKKYPGLRLGQFLACVQHFYDDRYADNQASLFAVSDKKLLTNLLEMLTSDA